MEKYKNKEWLENQYIILKKSISQIARECDVNQHTILRWLKKFNIKRRTLSEAQRNRFGTEECLITNVLHRKCKRCNQFKPRTEEYFHKNKDSIDNLSTYCKTCVRQYSKNHYHKNKNYYKHHRLKNRYGLTLKDYNRLLKMQLFKCAICGINDIEKKLVVDHDHKTGKVRGLLCNRCNKMLGVSKENVFILIKTIKYIKKHNFK